MKMAVFNAKLSYFLKILFRKGLCRFRKCFPIIIFLFVGVSIVLSTSAALNEDKNKTVEESPVDDRLKRHLLKRAKELLTKSPAVVGSKQLEPKRSIDLPNRNLAQNDLCKPLHYIPNSESRPVTALVSFPGSGNTWLRHLIQQATGVFTGSQYVDQVLQRKGFPGEAVTDARVAVVKTHEWGPQIRQRFQKAVLLIRPPGPAIQALFNLYNGGGHTGIAMDWRYKKDGGEYWANFVSGYTRDWHSTNLDWIRNFTGPLHVVRYETLRTDLGPTLRTLVQFLDLPLDEGALRCAVERQEGAHHRKARGVDRFTDQMKEELKAVEEEVFQEVDRYINSHS